MTTSPVGMSQNSRMASWSCARYSPIASSPRMRSAGVEAFEPNQPAQPMYAVYNATGTATRERQPDEERRVLVAVCGAVRSMVCGVAWVQLGRLVAHNRSTGAR